VTTCQLPGPVCRRLQSVLAVHLNRYRVAERERARPRRSRPMNRARCRCRLRSHRTCSGVTGLRSAPPSATRTASLARKPAAPVCSHYWAQHGAQPPPVLPGTYQGVVCRSVATRPRAAPRRPTVRRGRNTGRGQTVALTEDETPTAMFQTLTDYAKSNHLPAPKAQPVPGDSRLAKSAPVRCPVAWCGASRSTRTKRRWIPKRSMPWRRAPTS